MGFYLDQPPLQACGKTKRLLIAHEALILNPPPKSVEHDTPSGHILVVVVDNASFEAALLCFEQYDLDRVFHSQLSGDTRPTTFLAVPIAEVKKLCDPAIHSRFATLQ